MDTCFVMQVFDGGAYDRRYEETFAPAIRAGGANPVRADKMLGTKPVIEKIEAAIRAATIAFAEISENNPNVFTELGFALNLGVPLVMVCDRAKRSALPFDISHRPVIFYRTESQGDFEQLSREVEAAVGAALSEAAEVARARQTSLAKNANSEETDAIKSRILLEILEGEMGDPDGLSAYALKNAMSRNGVSDGLTSLAVLALEREGLVQPHRTQDYNGNDYLAFQLTDKGKDLLLSQYADIKRSEEMRLRTSGPVSAAKPAPAFDADLDDDVPF